MNLVHSRMRGNLLGVTAAALLVMTSGQVLFGQIEPPTPAPGCKPLSAPQPAAQVTNTALRSNAEPIRTLSVTITTSNDWFAGTDNQVWFDIGPMAWQLQGSFPRGSTRTIGPLDLTRAATDPLYVDDIVEVRLEKKGINGWTDAPDSLIDPLLPSGKISPTEIVGVYQKQVAVAQYGANQAAASLAALNGLIDQQEAVVQAANKALSNEEESARKIPADIASLNNRIIDAQAHLATTAQHIIGKVPVPGICTRKVKFVRVAYPCVQTVNETIINAAFTSLTNTVQNLTKEKNDLEAKLAQESIEKQIESQKLILASSVKVDALTRKVSAEAAATAANESLDVAQKGLDEAQKMAAALPAVGIDIPHPNQWKPSQITVTVNGRVFGTYGIEERLKAGHSNWTKLVRPMAPGEEFVRFLRAVPNIQSTHAGEDIAGASTIFKNLGISGWKSGPIPQATVQGRLIHPPSCGSDGYVSLDLDVQTVTVDKALLGSADDPVKVNTESFPHPRFIRIEYLRVDDHGNLDERYVDWHVGEVFQVSGPVMWDTDKSGFFELHPIGAGAVQPVSQ
jgi:hypothetical protein